MQSRVVTLLDNYNGFSSQVRRLRESRQLKAALMSRRRKQLAKKGLGPQSLDAFVAAVLINKGRK